MFLCPDYSCKTGRYGPHCSKACNCAPGHEACHVATGFCFHGCSYNYGGVDCRRGEVFFVEKVDVLFCSE